MWEASCRLATKSVEPQIARLTAAEKRHFDPQILPQSSDILKISGDRGCLWEMESPFGKRNLKWLGHQYSAFFCFFCLPLDGVFASCANRGFPTRY